MGKVKELSIEEYITHQMAQLDKQEVDLERHARKLVDKLNPRIEFTLEEVIL